MTARKVLGRRGLWIVWLLLMAVCERTVAAEPDSLPQLRTGAEVLMEGGYEALSGCRVAVVANQTSLVGNTHLVDTLLAKGVRVKKIFCPEHGFRGELAEGKAVKSGVDASTGLPILSLYGKNKKPTSRQMEDVDAVVFDLQDVGCRFYTYLSTLHYVMEACSERGVPLWVLDRPNPNGHYVDGPVLDTASMRSFVGMHPVPVVYGMTIGEYARMVNGEHWLGGGKECQLRVVEMQGYCRSGVYRLPVPPSPNLRTPHAIALYPSLCLFEGTHCGVGRGTAFPFEWVTYGQDTLDLRSQRVSDTGLTLAYLLEMHRRVPKGKFFLTNNFFDRLAGTAKLRRQMEQGMGEGEIRASWQPALRRFKTVRSRYLLYADIRAKE